MKLGTIVFSLVVFTVSTCMAKEFLYLANQKSPANYTAFVETYLTRYGYLQPSNARDVNPRHVRDALKRFQKFVQVNITGEADEPTIRMMSMPRCGLLDTQPEQVIKWNVTRVTYRFLNGSTKLSMSDIRSAAKKAFSLWSKPSGLTFVETKGSAMMEIQFSKGNHGDGYHFDGKFGVLAHAFFPVSDPIGGDTHFDDEETWVLGGKKGVDFLYIATHEFGHALGLGHSEDKNSVMIPFYPGYKKNLQLNSEDISRIKKIYN
ncbi:72 kDa type IV collagenase-like [Argonauta hians]